MNSNTSTVTGILAQQVATSPNDTAVIYSGQDTSFVELDVLSRRVAQALINLSISGNPRSTARLIYRRQKFHL